MARAIETNIYCRTCQKSLRLCRTMSYAKALMDGANDHNNGRTIAYMDVPMKYDEYELEISSHIGAGHEVIVI